ncbi:MAG: lipoprotein signal peptidase [Prevotellaceae bacterium]|jgi:signal peptidase II|nr:lipoprotein signal peptidase [Prevotellaceae bacterium]
MRNATKTILFIVFLLLIDQCVKVWVKTSMSLGESIHVFDWFQIAFVENPGMAFGWSFGNKTILTIFRVLVSAFILYYICVLVKQQYKQSYIFCVSLIFAGAIGNIIDCLFYGVIFSESAFGRVAEWFPAGGGYAPLLEGKVVDMFYFPLFTFPDWVPWLRGEVFFSPVFNVADAAMTTGIFILILFFMRDFNVTFDRVFSRKKTKDKTE